MADGKYTRLYHQFISEYPEVYDGPLLAPFTRLLIEADIFWPEEARWGGLATAAEMTRLEDCGLVERHGSRYSMRGLDKERKRRQRAGRKGAKARWEDRAEATETLGRIANAMQTHSERNAKGMPRRDETRRDKTRKDETKRLTPLKNVLGGAQT